VKERRSRPERHTQAVAGELVQLVAFGVGEGDYALDIMRIKEIINPLPVVRVPKAPAFIEGVVQLRGAILPVVDLRRRFDLAPTPATRLTKVLIAAIDTGDKRMIVGLVVDRVREPIRVSPQNLHPAPALAQGETPYFSGVVHHRDRIFMVLDIDAVLSSHEKISLAGLAAKKEAAGAS
jgi:purine-binding chemotaxis protein CheW